MEESQSVDAERPTSDSSAWLDALVERQRAEDERKLTCLWTIGVQNRGMGRANYAVITQGEELIAECQTREIAEHIMRTHNESI